MNNNNNKKNLPDGYQTSSQPRDMIFMINTIVSC